MLCCVLVLFSLILFAINRFDSRNGENGCFVGFSRFLVQMWSRYLILQRLSKIFKSMRSCEVLPRAGHMYPRSRLEPQNENTNRASLRGQIPLWWGRHFLASRHEYQPNIFSCLNYSISAPESMSGRDLQQRQLFRESLPRQSGK